MKSRTVAILALPGVQLLDVSGPLDVFAEANNQVGRTVYELLLVGTKAGPVRSSSGVRLVTDWTIGQRAAEGRLHTLLVAGCPHAADVPAGHPVVDWVQRQSKLARRFGSVCSGAFYLAEAGLLDGRRVTTHWAVADALARRYPRAIVEADAIHVRDGKLRTAAGVTAGLDLALSLVEEDLGREVAMRVAAQLVMFFKRPGGQLQFSRKGEMPPAGRSALQEMQRWVTAHPALDHRVPTLAKRLGLSARHFARLFRREVGVTPAAWIEAARIDAARRRLEAGREVPKQVAALCGFANADTLRRAFVRRVGVTPPEYRRRFVQATA